MAILGASAVLTIPFSVMIMCALATAVALYIYFYVYRELLQVAPDVADSD